MRGPGSRERKGWRGQEGVGGVKRPGGVLGSEGPGMLRREGVINTYFQFFLYNYVCD